jgi:hypothetical protein
MNAKISVENVPNVNATIKKPEELRFGVSFDGGPEATVKIRYSTDLAPSSGFDYTFDFELE